MTAFEISTVESGPRKVTRRVEVSAPAAEVFSLISNPHRHIEIDGSGTIRDVEVRGPDHLAVGDKFSVGMKQYGVPYRITSTVTAASYQEGLLWPAIGANPPGAKAPGYGSWAQPPRIEDRYLKGATK